MARYSIEGQDTADTSLAVLGLLQDATTQRRGKVYDLMFGSEATAADNPFLWVIDRGTTALGTSTSVVPEPLDPADAAALLDGGDGFTVQPTIGTRLLSIPLNQRATFRWVAAPGSELVLAATANLSLLVNVPVSSAVAVAATMLFEEQ